MRGDVKIADARPVRQRERHRRGLPAPAALRVDKYGERRGLMNSTNPPGPRYAAEEFEAAHGDWAWYLLPTITCARWASRVTENHRRSVAIDVWGQP